MKKSIALFLVLIGTACSSSTTSQGMETVVSPPPESLPSSQAPSLSITEPQDNPTLSILPSPSFMLTPAATLTVAEYPPLAEIGNYLAYPTETSIVVLNPDGSGRKIIPIPEGTKFEGFSPNGRLAALRSCTQMTDEEICTGDESLSLVGIPDGTVQSIIEVPYTEKSDPDVDRFISKPRWSNNGRYLVFSAWPSGSSLDLFSYDVTSALLRRLTDDSIMTFVKDISPSGRWILFSNCNPDYPEGADRDVWTWNCTLYSTQPANQANQGIRKLATYTDGFASAGLILDDWADDNRVFYSLECSIDIGECGELSLQNVGSGSIQTVIHGTFIQYGAVIPYWSYDRENEKLLIISSRFPSEYDMGWNIISLEGDILPLSIDFEDFNAVFFRNGLKIRFLVSTGSGWYGVTLKGEAEFLSTRSAPSIRQVNGGPFVVYDDTGIDYFSKDDILTYSLNDLSVEDALLGPDMQSLYLLTDEDGFVKIYFWSIPDPDPSLVYECDSHSPGCVADVHSFRDPKLKWVFE